MGERERLLYGKNQNRFQFWLLARSKFKEKKWNSGSVLTTWLAVKKEPKNSFDRMNKVDMDDYSSLSVLKLSLDPDSDFYTGFWVQEHDFSQILFIPPKTWVRFRNLIPSSGFKFWLWAWLRLRSTVRILPLLNWHSFLFSPKSKTLNRLSHKRASESSTKSSQLQSSSWIQKVNVTKTCSTSSYVMWRQIASPKCERKSRALVEPCKSRLFGRDCWKRSRLGAKEWWAKTPIRRVWAMRSFITFSCCSIWRSRTRKRTRTSITWPARWSPFPPNWEERSRRSKGR